MPISNTSMVALTSMYEVNAFFDRYVLFQLIFFLTFSSTCARLSAAINWVCFVFCYVLYQFAWGLSVSFHG